MTLTSSSPFRPVQFMNTTSMKPPRKTYGSFPTGPIDQRLLLSMRVASDRITELEREKRELQLDVETLENQLIIEQMTNPHREFYWKWIALGLVGLMFLTSGCHTLNRVRPLDRHDAADIRKSVESMKDAAAGIVFYPTK